MGSPWPAPEPDDQIGDGRGPNYALRRVVVAVVVVALVGGGVAWFAGRGGDEASDTGARGEWDTVVVQSARTGVISLFDREPVDGAADEIDDHSTELIGLLDVGLPGRLVVGVAGEPATDGLGVLDLATGDVVEVVVEADGISRLDTSAYLLASSGPRDPLGLVDVAAGEVIDLLSFVGGGDPIIDPSLVRIDPEHSHVAFTSLGALETVLVDLDAQTSVSLAGSLVDIASGAVLTITNRGQTDLIDLYSFDGERVGTVETDAAAGGVLLDDRTALVVTSAGALIRIDFDDESIDDISSVAQQLSGDPAGTDTTGATDGDEVDGEQPDLVRSVVPVLDRTRLIITGADGIVVADVDGNVVAAERVVDAQVPVSITSGDRCVLIGGVDAEQTLWDATDGARIETFDPGFMIGRSADGCTITYDERASGGTEARQRFVGPDVDRTIDAQLGAVAPDGTAAIGRDDDGAFVIDAATGERIDLEVDTLFAVFVVR